MNMRPSWNTYFMTIAFVVAQRSLDPETKHGCVVVADDHTILSVGYNSPPRGCDDAKIPLTRPEKYDYFAHAEENAISNAAKHGIPLDGSTFYITGIPCTKCFRSIVNVGAHTIVVGDVISNCVKDIPSEPYLRMGLHSTVDEIRHSCYIRDGHLDVQNLLENTKQYINNTCRG